MKSRLLVAAILIAASAASAASFAEELATRSSYLDGVNAADQIAIDEYRSRTGASVEEARLSLAVEELGDVVVEELRRDYEDRFSGLYWTDFPNQGITVRLTGLSPVRDRVFSTDAGPILVRFQTGAQLTLKELSDRLQKAMPMLKKTIPSLQGAWIDEIEGNVVLEVMTNSADRQVFESEQNKLEEALGFSVRYAWVTQVHADPVPPVAKLSIVPFSQTSSSSLDGGTQLIGGSGSCTAGFTTKDAVTGVVGVLTAGHCPNDLTYMNYPVPPSIIPSVVVPTTMQGEKWGGAYDFQWHSFPVGTAVGGGYCTSFTSCSNVVIFANSTPPVGRSACHMSMATGRSCGKVVSNSYVYSGTCDNVDQKTCPDGNWMRIEGPNLACAGGDSGGPVYDGYTAMGLAKAALSSSALPGGCSALIVMPIGRINALGLKLL